jgi:sulfatase maturation enzyme AslB (radical SAM superfamily)
MLGDCSMTRDAVILVTIAGVGIAHASNRMKMFRPTFETVLAALDFIKEHNNRTDKEFTINMIEIKHCLPE